MTRFAARAATGLGLALLAVPCIAPTVAGGEALVSADPDPAHPSPAHAALLAGPARQPTWAVAGGKVKVRFLHGPDTTGARDAAVSRLTAEPGVEVAVHVHESSDELLWIQEGGGTMRIGADLFRVGAGDAVRVPRGVPHGVAVDAAGPALVAVQVYTPSGPEQRFTQGERVAE